jgi:hypothetical protein
MQSIFVKKALPVQLDPNIVTNGQIIMRGDT